MKHYKAYEQPFNAAANWGKGRSKAAAKRRAKRLAAERFEKEAGHTRSGAVIVPLRTK